MAKIAARIISGGQTGVDRAALDFAVRRGLDYGGWCPRGGWAEDFPQPPGVLRRYPGLAPTPSADPKQRTLWNVRDSDATLIIGGTPCISEGSAFTLSCAVALGKPHHFVDLCSPNAARAAKAWIEGARPETLNVAGPRESESPGAYAAATQFLGILIDASEGRRS
jgi:hypothetical protein